ncbi:MAG: sigma-70 family RNA polymerase sigma factor [Bryobacteraceae bacterium]
MSREEFAALYERHAAEILRYAIRCTGRREIAEEIAADAFLKMYRSRGIDPARAGAWLTAVVKNMATDHWRRAAIERRHPAEPAAGVEPMSAKVWDELLDEPALKPEHRACLTLHYLHGMERREITSHTGMSDNQVKSCLQYGLKLLRKAWGGTR